MNASDLFARFSAIEAKKNPLEKLTPVAFVGIFLFVLMSNSCLLSGQNPGSSTVAHNSHTFPDQFTPTEILRLNWGQGEKQVGLLQVPGANYGPQSFAVDETQNQIYILDSANSRVMLFALHGSELSAFPVLSAADDIALTLDGEMLVLSKPEKKVVRYYSTGSQRNFYPVPDTLSPITGIQFSAESGLLLETADQSSLLLTLEEATSGKQPPAAQPRASRSLGLKRGGASFYYLERTRAGEGNMRILDSSGNTQRALHIKSKHQPIASLMLIGVDQDGNSYLVVEESDSSAAVKRYLREFDDQGNLLAEALIPYSAYVFTFKDLRVTKDGRIYQLLPLKESVRILEWKIATTAERPTPEFTNEIFSNSVVHPGEVIPGDQTKSTAEEPFSMALQVQPQAVIASSDVLSRAESYRAHVFNVASSNIAAGAGIRCGGKTVQTYIVSPGTYTGIPYKWGGFSGLTGVTTVIDPYTGFNFDEGLAAGKFAGDRNTSGSSGSSCAVGVDCSGFVSQVWGLATKQSTSTLPGVSCCLNSSCTGSVTPSYPEYVLPGDILNSASSAGGVGHVRLVNVRNADGSFSVYESSARTWNVATYAYTPSQLSSNYYYPFRGREVSNSLQSGDQIRASAVVPVRSCASSSCDPPICTAPAGAIGTLAGTPQDADGYLWWQVTWSSGCPSGTTGWSIGCYLQPYSGSIQLLTPTVKVVPASNTITTSQSDIITVTVSGSSGDPLPTGTVTLTGGSFSGSGTLNNGAAVITIPAATFSTAGTHQLTATYQGDSNYSSATGTATITVKRSKGH